MRRYVPFALVAVLAASAYPLLPGDEVREPDPTAIGPTHGAIVVEPPGGTAARAWEYQYSPVGGAGEGREMLKAFNGLGRDGWEYAGTVSDGTNYLFKRPAR